MKKIAGIWWPDDVGVKWKHSQRHVLSLEWSLKRCGRWRTAVQAGGNIGLWPRRMAEYGFRRVLTFEPDEASRACLLKNVPQNIVEVFHYALGDKPGRCSIAHRSLGSHTVTPGKTIEVVTLDSFGLVDLDLLQLDVEGYEWHALEGAKQTIERCRPLIQLELRNFTSKYGRSDAEVRSRLGFHGYREVSSQPGNDFVFEYRP